MPSNASLMPEAYRQLLLNEENLGGIGAGMNHNPEDLPCQVLTGTKFISLLRYSSRSGTPYTSSTIALTKAMQGDRYNRLGMKKL